MGLTSDRDGFADSSRNLRGMVNGDGGGGEKLFSAGILLLVFLSILIALYFFVLGMLISNADFQPICVADFVSKLQWWLAFDIFCIFFLFEVYPRKAQEFMMN